MKSKRVALFVLTEQNLVSFIGLVAIFLFFISCGVLFNTTIKRVTKITEIRSRERIELAKIAKIQNKILVDGVQDKKIDALKKKYQSQIETQATQIEKLKRQVNNLNKNIFLSEDSNE